MRIEISPPNLTVTLSAGPAFAWECDNCPATAFEVTTDGTLIEVIQTDDIAPRAGDPSNRKSRFRRPSGWQGETKATLRVTVPPTATVLAVKILSGKVEVEGLQLERLQLHTGNGTLEVRNVQVSELNLESDNGMAKATAVSANEAVIHCGNGVASLRRVSIRQHCRVETDNGIAHISGIEQDDFGYRVEAGNGAAWVFGKLRLSEVTRPGSPCYTVYCHNGLAIGR